MSFEFGDLGITDFCRQPARSQRCGGVGSIISAKTPTQYKAIKTLRSRMEAAHRAANIDNYTKAVEMKQLL